MLGGVIVTCPISWPFLSMHPCCVVYIGCFVQSSLCSLMFGLFQKYLSSACLHHQLTKFIKSPCLLRSLLLLMSCFWTLQGWRTCNWGGMGSGLSFSTFRKSYQPNSKKFCATVADRAASSIWKLAVAHSGIIFVFSITIFNLCLFSVSDFSLKWNTYYLDTFYR